MYASTFFPSWSNGIWSAEMLERVDRTPINDAALVTWYERASVEARRWRRAAAEAFAWRWRDVDRAAMPSGLRQCGDGVNSIGNWLRWNIVWNGQIWTYQRSRKRHCWRQWQHHDYQRKETGLLLEVPGNDAKPLRGIPLILVHQTIKIRHSYRSCWMISDEDWEGNMQAFEMVYFDHFDELGFDEAAKIFWARDPNMRSSDAVKRLRLSGYVNQKGAIWLRIMAWAWGYAL